VSNNFLYYFKGSLRSPRGPACRRADAPVSAPLRPGRRPAREDEPEEKARRGWGGRLHGFRQPPWGEPRRSGAHFGLLRAGEVLPESRQAYEPLIPRPKPAPAQTRSADLRASTIAK
jgi:hypothetical protein